MATPTTGKKVKLGRGIRIIIISNVYDNFKKLEAKGKCKPALEQTVEATGVTAPTIWDILTEREKRKEGLNHQPSGRVSREKAIVDDFDREAIRRKIYSM